MNKIKLILLLIIVFILSTQVSACSGFGFAAGEKNKTIKIGKTNFDYEIPYVEITRQVALEKGYNVEIIKKDIDSMYEALANGKVDIWPGIRLPENHEEYHKEYEDKYELGSIIFERAPTGFVVSEFFEANSIDGLKGKETSINNRVFSVKSPPNLLENSKKTIKNYNLNLEIETYTHTSLREKVGDAFEKDIEVLFVGWRPDAIFRQYPLKILDDTKGYWPNGSCYFGIKNGFESKAPGLYKFCNNFNMSIEDTENYLFGYRVQNKSAEGLAKAWIEKNRQQIDEWAQKEQANRGFLSLFNNFREKNNDDNKNGFLSWPYYDNEETERDTPSQPENRTDNETKPKREEDEEDNDNRGDIDSLSSSENKLLELTNQERDKENLTQYSVDSKLVELARKKSRDMYENNYFSHESPTYGSPYDMKKDAGINARIMGAENIAKANSVNRAHTLLMNSQEHRENILDERHDTIGIGIIESPNGTLYITQLFTGD